MPQKPRLLTHNGETLPITEWVKRTGIPAATIRSRIDSFGWSHSESLTVPVDRRFSSPNAGRVAKGMPRPCPKLKRHYDGTAYVRWQSKGQRQWLGFGPWGSAEAIEGYRRFTLEWASGVIASKEIRGGCVVAELAELYLDFAEGYYRKRGERTSEYHLVSRAIAIMCDVAGSKLVCELKPDDLRLMIQACVDAGLYRETCNAYRHRILRCLKWGCAQTDGTGKPLVPAQVHYALERVPGLAKGRTEAPDGEKIRAAKWPEVEAVFSHLHHHEPRRAVLEALIRFHWLTGMRSTDALTLRPMDLDKTYAEWCYRPEAHKQEHTGAELEYYLGPKAIAVIAPLLINCPNDRPIFMLPPASKGRSRWHAMDDTDYGRIVRAACLRAGVSWTPHQLRHSRATEVERIYESDEAAAQAIGDTPAVTRRVYIDPNSVVKRRIARETG